MPVDVVRSIPAACTWLVFLILEVSKQLRAMHARADSARSLQDSEICTRSVCAIVQCAAQLNRHPLQAQLTLQRWEQQEHLHLDKVEVDWAKRS